MSFMEFFDEMKGYQVISSLSKTVVVIHTTIWVFILGYIYNFMGRCTYVIPITIKVFILEYIYT